MSLSGLHIPNSVLGKLYKEVVVAPPELHSLPVQQSVEAPPVPEPVSIPVTQATPAPAAVITTAPQQRTVAMETAATTAPLVFLGNNQRNIAILVYYPNDKHIAEAPLDLLSKMLTACQLNLGGVAIINTATQKVTYQLLEEQLQSKTVILFGITAGAIALPMQFPLYKDQAFANAVYLQSEALDVMLPNTNESKISKTSLWSAFKRIFNL
ncbi:hypothetical protein [Gynurincola endophyticus]|uniref:hypothetical protein n=1 Tax=Gynurincola endophyticus TaxID=2479004 RepID=UPI000F8D4BAA|nr:hypothetical protein [Gynurincola endophyticus]